MPSACFLGGGRAIWRTTWCPVDTGLTQSRSCLVALILSAPSGPTPIGLLGLLGLGMKNSVISTMVYLISQPLFISFARYYATFSLASSNVSAFFMLTISNIVPESSGILPMKSLYASLVWLALDLPPVAIIYAASDMNFSCLAIFR